MRFRGFTLLLLLILTLSLASCGGTGGSGGSQQGNSGGDMQGMGHGQGSGETTGGMSGMKGMDDGSMDMGSSGMARQMVMENGKYSDKAFIDAMVPHHQSAIEMAKVALKNAEHEQIKNLAEDIVTAQQAEIEELKSIKREEFGTSEVPMGSGKMMGMTAPDELANQDPFDKAFIEAMIPHHQSAIAMAKVALEESDNAQIREIARDIVSAQKREIAQLQEWRQQWYPEG